jgi:hypothetical protein
VVIGAGHTIDRLRDVPCVSVPVSTPVGAFTVEVSLKMANTVAAAAA